jgi:hypothetical protein
MQTAVTLTFLSFTSEMKDEHREEKSAVAVVRTEHSDILQSVAS